MVLAGNIESLIDFFSFSAWIFYGGSMLSLIVQRFTRPEAPRPYKVGNDSFYREKLSSCVPASFVCMLRGGGSGLEQPLHTNTNHQVGCHILLT